MTKLSDDYVYTKIGMALVSAQRVEFITGRLLEVLEILDSGAYKITTSEFLERTAKSKKAIKTLGTIFSLLKLNPNLVVEDELDDYLKKRNLFVHISSNTKVIIRRHRCSKNCISPIRIIQNSFTRISRILNT